MKVILLNDIKEIGPADTVADVSDGYARNFLIPRKIAVAATIHSLQALEARKLSDEKKEKGRAALKELAQKINGMEINIAADTGESGKLFGSVTASDIAQKAYEALGVEVDKKKIVLAEPIKSTGLFEVTVRFTTDISAALKVNVSPASK